LSFRPAEQEHGELSRRTETLLAAAGMVVLMTMLVVTGIAWA
jgi:hypothetical protein